MVLTSKYDLGDVVFAAAIKNIEMTVTCPECLGDKKWTVTTPAGNRVTVDCPTCTYGYDVRGFIQVPNIIAMPTHLTIGQIRFEPHFGTDEGGFVYMCHETGIGGGMLWPEKILFESHSDAEEASQVLVAEATEKAVVKNSEELARKLKKFKSRKYCFTCEGSGRVAI